MRPASTANRDGSTDMGWACAPRVDRLARAPMLGIDLWMPEVYLFALHRICEHLKSELWHIPSGEIPSVSH
jgi:hypothetical protein